MPAVTWLPPVDQWHDGWRYTLLRQDQDGRQVLVGAVILSAEPGDGTAGRALTAEVVAKLGPLLDRLPERADPDAKWRRVASVYRVALAAKQPTGRAIEVAFKVAPGTASNLVMEARRRGFLPPTKPGKSAA